MKPDPSKLRAIRKIPAPTSKDELKTLPGMHNCLSRYIPGHSTLNRLLWELEKAMEFDWEAVHNKTKVRI